MKVVSQHLGVAECQMMSIYLDKNVGNFYFLKAQRDVGGQKGGSSDRGLFLDKETQLQRSWSNYTQLPTVIRYANAMSTRQVQPQIISAIKRSIENSHVPSTDHYMNFLKMYQTSELPP